MPAVLGLRGSGSFSADERPKNWREAILYLFPNGEAPLTAFLSKLRSQPTDDPEFNWWEKRLPTQRMQVNGAQTNVETTIEVDSGAKDCVAGTLLLNERTNEILRVTTDPTADTAVVVERGFGTVVGTAMNDNDMLVVVGNVHEEGSGVPTAKTYAPTKLSNFTQIFRMSLMLTRTARKTRLRWDNTGPYREAKREALSLYAIEQEKAFIFGQKKETTGSAGLPLRATGGVLGFLTTNINGNFGTNIAGIGDIDQDTLNSRLEEEFRFGSTEKFALSGSTYLLAITTLAMKNGTLNIVPSDQTYGMKVVEWVTPFGNIMLRSHPLFNQHPEWRKNSLHLDVQNLVYRHIDDTMFIRNRQNPGDDASKDEFLGEAGLETNMEETHAYWQGVTGALVG